jgi:hypothetical protein
MRDLGSNMGDPDVFFDQFNSLLGVCLGALGVLGGCI